MYCNIVCVSEIKKNGSNKKDAMVWNFGDAGCGSGVSTV